MSQKLRQVEGAREVFHLWFMKSFECVRLIFYFFIIKFYRFSTLHHKSYKKTRSHSLKKTELALFSASKTDYVKIQSIDNISITLSQLTSKESDKPPLLFIHGSFHASWCFEENYMPFFASNNYNCYAINLRGTSLSPTISATYVTISEHLLDLSTTIDYIESIHNQKVVLLSHSFGGIIVMKLLENDYIRSKIKAVALLCSVPPSGNGPMTLRFLRNKFIGSFQIVSGFVFKNVVSNENLCRKLFFDNFLQSADIQRYMKHFDEDSKVTIDLKDLSSKLPIATTTNQFQAAWLNKEINIPRLVIGAENDFIVDREGVEETANYFNVSATLLPNLYHDVMLGPIWKISADVILRWLKSFQIHQ